MKEDKPLVIGSNGYVSVEEARLGAKLTTNADDVVFLRYTDWKGAVDYAWVWPPEHAEKLLSQNPRMERVQ